jgi:hypothetical protein
VNRQTGVPVQRRNPATRRADAMVTVKGQAATVNGRPAAGHASAIVTTPTVSLSAHDTYVAIRL